MERTNWLIDMLDRSAEGLFDHIEDKISKLSDDFNDSLKEYLKQLRRTRGMDLNIRLKQITKLQKL